MGKLSLWHWVLGGSMLSMLLAASVLLSGNFNKNNKVDHLSLGNSDHADRMVTDTTSGNGEYSSLPTVSPFDVKESTVIEDATLGETKVPTSLSGLNDTNEVVAELTIEDIPALVDRLQHSLSEVEWQGIRASLKNSPEALRQLIDLFRQMPSGPEKNQLARMLSEVGGDDVLLATSELVYSADVDSRKLGLAMLQKLQPNNRQAHTIASDLLLSEVEPDIIVDTLTAFAKPGFVEESNRDFLVDQVVYLTEHNDHLVRGISYDILSRWTSSEQHVSVFLNGLNDPHPHVRKLTAFALVGSKTDSLEVKQSLKSLVVSDAEPESVRRGAILALRGMSISAIERDELLDIEQQLNTVIR